MTFRAAMALLEETVRVMAGDDEAAEAADERFHLLIAENSGSPIIEHFVRTLWRMRNEAPRVVQVYSNVCKSGFEDRIEEHRAVLDAIRNRDPTRRGWRCASTSAACSKPCWRPRRPRPSCNCAARR
jgi:DNA-binding GntR family transcriptional regulator